MKFPDNEGSLNHIKGYELWHESLNACVELTQSKRQEENPEFSQLLKRFRTNNPSKADLKLLNTRIIDRVTKPGSAAVFADATNIGQLF